MLPGSPLATCFILHGRDSDVEESLLEECDFTCRLSSEPFIVLPAPRESFLMSQTSVSIVAEGSGALLCCLECRPLGSPPLDGKCIYGELELSMLLLLLIELNCLEELKSLKDVSSMHFPSGFRTFLRCAIYHLCEQRVDIPKIQSPTFKHTLKSFYHFGCFIDIIEMNKHIRFLKGEDYQ